MFAILQSRANSRRLSPHCNDWNIEQDLISLETTQKYRASTGVKGYFAKAIGGFRKELDGDDKASLKRNPNGP